MSTKVKICYLVRITISGIILRPSSANSHFVLPNIMGVIALFVILSSIQGCATKETTPPPPGIDRSLINPATKIGVFSLFKNEIVEKDSIGFAGIFMEISEIKYLKEDLREFHTHEILHDTLISSLRTKLPAYYSIVKVHYIPSTKTWDYIVKQTWDMDDEDVKKLSEIDMQLILVSTEALKDNRGEKTPMLSVTAILRWAKGGAEIWRRDIAVWGDPILYAILNMDSPSNKIDKYDAFNEDNVDRSTEGLGEVYGELAKKAAEKLIIEMQLNN